MNDILTAEDETEHLTGTATRGVVIRQESPAKGEFDPPVDDCRSQLARILSSADFDANDRKHRFLSYVVEETLAGRGNRIKAYSIAVEVFGRDASFDPQSDPIVRVEAGHLRRALERYYLTAGHDDPIVIGIPKGGYVPTFSVRHTPGATDGAPRTVVDPVPSRPDGRIRFLLTASVTILIVAAIALAWWGYSFGPSPNEPEIPRLLVERFDDLTGTDDSAALALGLTQEVISQLSKFKDIVVVHSSDPPTSRQIRYALAGSVDLSQDTFRFRVRMFNRADGSVQWAHSYEGAKSVTDLLKAQADVAGNVATSLAQAYGAIFQADARLVVPNPPDDWAAYSCTLLYYSYRAHFDPEIRPTVRACLEESVERFPGYATAWALLSLTLIDEVRFGYPFDSALSAEQIDRALAAADRAVKLEPLNVRGLHAQMLALYFRREIDAAMRVGSRAMMINPNDTIHMGEYGYRLALSGNWNDGCPLVSEARERNPGPLAYYEVGLAVCSYFDGEYGQAAAWIRKANARTNALYHVIAAAIFAEAGQEADLERERSWLLEHAPGLINNVREEALLRFGRVEDAERFLGSLRKAGLTFAE